MGLSEGLRIHVRTKPYVDFKLYTHKVFTIQPGLNSLVGCNGSGKSTLIDLYIKSYFNDNSIPFIEWNDRRKGGTMYMDALLNKYGDTDGLVEMALSSEGERIVCALIPVFKNIGRSFREHKGGTFGILFDAIDSGMSIDEIIEIRSLLLDVVIPDAESCGVTPYIVIAANNYEWCADERIHNIDITSGKFLTLDSYDKYRQAILDSRKSKDKFRGVEDNE